MDFEFRSKLNLIALDKFKTKFTEILNNHFRKDSAQIKKFLFNCITKNNYIEKFRMYFKSQIKTDTVYSFNNRPSGGASIEPGNIFMRINKNGREMTVDLANIAKWTDYNDEDQPLIRFMTIMNDALEKLSEHFNNPSVTKSFDNAKKLATSMWYNIFLYTQTVSTRIEKQGILLLCIYFALKKYNFKISKQQIYQWLRLKFSILGIDSYDPIIKEIFGGTSFETYFFAIEEEFELPENIRKAKELFLRQFADKGYRISLNEIKKKEIELGIILYLATKFENSEINLEFLLLKNPSVHHTAILRGLEEIQTFYKLHKELEKGIDRLK